jgi:D-alanyl-lipoteichoic acid acyltransferase DltB (MBOAT superfamily)
VSETAVTPAQTIPALAEPTTTTEPWDGIMGLREWTLVAASLVGFGVLLPPQTWIPFIVAVAAAFVIRPTGFSRSRKMLLIVAVLVGFVAGRQALRPPPVDTVLWEGFGIAGFFMLRCIDYAVSKRAASAPVGLADRVGACLLYVFFLPTLVAGPVLTFREFGRAYVRRAADLAREAPALVTRVAIGAAKFYLVVPVIRQARVVLQRAAFTGTTPGWMPLELPGQLLLWGSVTCTFLVIVVAFSGFCDIGIGVARLLGFRVYENLDRPLASRTPVEFWQRWNVSTYRWLTTHVFYPYWDHSRVTAKIVTTFAASAVWHAAAVRVLNADSTAQMLLAMAINCAGVLLVARLAGSPLGAWARKDRGRAWRWLGQAAGTVATLVFMMLVFQFFAGGLASRPLEQTFLLLRALLFGIPS